MLVKEFMLERGPINPDFSGIVTNDDMLTAINVSGDPDAHPDTYAVAYGAVEGVDAKLNAQKKTKTYIYAGQSTTKNATQRTFKVTGDLFQGDDFQDYVFSHKIKYGVGEAVITDYVRFNILNGKGEKGKVAIIVNSDGGGKGGENAGIDVDMEKTRDEPKEYVYSPGADQLIAVNVTSVAATDSGKTTVTATPAIPAGMSAKYKTGANVALPSLDAVITAGWTEFISGSDYTATTGQEFAVVYAGADNKVKYAGKATVNAKA